MSEATFTSQGVNVLQNLYPVGTRVQMTESMDDIHPVLKGETGTVKMVDDIGQIHVHWDSGRILALNAAVDSFEVIS